ncbi:LacI family DNA-binding transcriptional regulator [Dactylosporangium sucinum]|uniref:LacI family transcriptional regulator n=1 Tax=Dactylosporangium sucinum TaxID=1424081 RepID=A0A917SYY0_9ACTN|nr:LacI family DNA-binding transcriptional regulator [Dactylosporangium sucinum]GGM03168.1 LacI family transcriptional regulator [Dactylosporangium sucinum]
MIARLKDVAARAGVSVKTVSNVVNGYAFVTEENRRRVQEAIDHLGYVPNIGARNLRKGRTGFLTLAVPELVNPYFAELCGLVMSAAARHDWTVLIEQTGGVRDQEMTVINMAHRSLVDAIILSPIDLHPTDLAQAAAGTPLVLLGERALHAPAHHVAIDNVAAATAATRHLVDLGRRRIAAIGDQPGRHGTAALRRNGYLGALQAAGITPDPALTVRAEAYSRAEGAAAMRRLLDLPEPPDAVFCFNDLLAVGALSAARDRGLSVPGDLAVVGFDGVDEGNYTAPRLTTIAPDKAAIAEAAINLARAAVHDGAQDPQDIVTPFTLVVRESTVA